MVATPVAEPRHHLSSKIAGLPARRLVLAPVGVGGLADLVTGLTCGCPRPCRRNQGARRSPATRPAPATAEPCRRPKDPRSQGGFSGTGRSCGSPCCGFRRCRPRLAVVVGLDLRLVLVVQRAEAAQRTPGCGRIPESGTRSRGGQRRSRTARTGQSSRPRPAALREPAPGAGDRAI